MRPYVIINCASSIDGKIALVGKKEIKLSNEEDFARVHMLRNECDAILVGIETVLTDNPKLTVKEKYVHNPKQPIKIVLDSKLRIPEESNVLKGGKTIIATISNKIRKFNENVEIIRCKEKNGKIDLNELMKILYKKGIRKLLVEGGSTVIWEFLRNGIVDEMFIYFSPIIIGGDAPTIAGGDGAKKDEETIKMEIKKIVRMGEGYLVKLVPKSPTT